MTVRDLIQKLLRYDLNETIAYSLWSKVDVQDLLKQQGRNPDLLNDSIIEEILDDFHLEQDSSIGLNWRVLEEICEWHLQTQGIARIHQSVTNKENTNGND
jgi:hypothetical protein